MRRLVLSISGYTIEILLHPTEYKQEEKLFLSQISSRYKGFILDSTVVDTVDFSIHILQKNISQVLKYKESNYIEFYDVANSKNAIHSFYSISLPQLAQLLQQIITHLLLSGSGFVMHGSCCIFDERALVFLGPSGRGKSTMIHMLRGVGVPFADDIVIIRKVGDTYHCFQSPILDKQGWIKKNSRGYEIRGLYALNQSKKTYLGNDSHTLLKIQVIEALVTDIKTIRFFSKTCLRFIQQFRKIHSLYFEKNRGKISKLLTSN